MQASVHSFCESDGSGTVLLDSGRLLPFASEVFAGSALRLLRSGQRVSVVVEGDPEREGAVVSRLWIVGIGPGETIR